MASSLSYTSAKNDNMNAAFVKVKFVSLYEFVYLLLLIEQIYVIEQGKNTKMFMSDCPGGNRNFNINSNVQ